MADPQVDAYVEALGTWQAELRAMRPLLAKAGLDETIKWRKPCWSHEGRNIVIFQPFKEHAALMFFQGALLDDPDGWLKDQGENSRSAKRLEFRSVADVTAAKGVIADFCAKAKLVRESGESVPKAPPPGPRDYPIELTIAFEDDSALRTAFEALTPGRQRGYLLHFAGAKQSSTRSARIERMAPRILDGLGMHD